MNKSSFTANNSKWAYLVLLIAIVIIITIFRIRVQMEIGPILDTFDYLADAAEFAGKGFGYTDLNRPPFLSLITALFFIFGKLSITPIYIADGLLSIIGSIGLYLLLKERFRPVISFIGALLYVTFPIVVTYTGAGFNDVSSVGIAIWAIYFTYLAVEKNSKWFYLSFPVALLAFLTRFNMALIIFPIFLYILINWDKIKNRQDIIIGIGLSILILLPFIFYLWIKFGNPLYTFMDFFGTSSAMIGSGSSEHFAYRPDPLFYIKNLPAYIGVQSLMVLLLTLIAFIFYLFRQFKNSLNRPKLNKINGEHLKTKLIILIALIILLLFTFTQYHYLVTELIFFAIAYISYLISRDLGFKDRKMDLLFISWFMAFFIFQSVYIAKDHRYIIPMAVPVAYFLTRAFYWSVNKLKINYKNKNLTLYIGTIILVILSLFSALNQIPGIETDNKNSMLFNQDAQQASAWLINHDPEYKSKTIYADLWSYFAWYLQRDVGKMPIFKNNQTMYVGPKDYNFTKEDNAAFDRELEKLRPDYYISAWQGMNFTSYQPIQKFGAVTIFKRTN